jgi:cysteinyl-tRNA synthetase
MLLEGRRHARATGNYAMADDVRARLTALGIEINDAPDGSSSYELPD